MFDPKKPRLEEQIEEYTRRILTYDTDILNAFRGILNRSQRPSYFVIPLHTDWPSMSDSRRERVNNAFAAGLTWNTRKNYPKFIQCTRWTKSRFFIVVVAGWKGQIHYEDSKGELHVDFENDRTNLWHPHFWVENLEGFSVPLEETLDQSDSNKFIPERSHLIHVEAIVVRLRFRLSGEIYFAQLDSFPPTEFDPFRSQIDNLGRVSSLHFPLQRKDPNCILRCGVKVLMEPFSGNINMLFLSLIATITSSSPTTAADLWSEWDVCKFTKDQPIPI